ncbi:hypothetical protein EST38_g5550 [Candolleomyces aberdarensis]|uniref:CFEM domain-containing protein n=1 Tax=Candolleomyces aberdarensis TaxID=2316362 RepID=A0A4Q2DND7_9AGAR|nr:hypothetical protein EST38_g5550 [Candolleomyces aberdarensis]
MRFSAVAALGAAASASASAIVSRQVPSCAIACLDEITSNSCSPTDNACLCRDAAFIATTTACITDTCPGDDTQTALALMQAICAAVGVTLTAPTGSPTGT